MTISVVIPVYNEERRILHTLKAIYDGSLLPTEIIVVDGGSSDHTVEIVMNSYPDVVLLNNPDKTAATGRNVGILEAHGEIIAFTDGDCLVARDWLRNIAKHFEDTDIDGLGGKVLNAVPENRYEEYWGNLAWNLIMSFPDESYEVREKNSTMLLLRQIAPIEETCFSESTVSASSLPIMRRTLTYAGAPLIVAQNWYMCRM